MSARACWCEEGWNNIKQMLDGNFVLWHVNTFGTHLDREVKLLAGTPAALEHAQKAGMNAAWLNAKRRWRGTERPENFRDQAGPSGLAAAAHDRQRTAIQLQQHILLATAPS